MTVTCSFVAVGTTVFDCLARVLPAERVRLGGIAAESTLLSPVSLVSSLLGDQYYIDVKSIPHAAKNLPNIPLERFQLIVGIPLPRLEYLRLHMLFPSAQANPRL